MNSRPWNIRPVGPNEGQKFTDCMDLKMGAPQSLQLSLITWSIPRGPDKALIDDFTGYQKERSRGGLNEALDKYLRPLEARWAKRFPNEFYTEIYKLKGLEWEIMRANRNQVVGHYTNDIVYARFSIGGARRDRTADLYNAIVALSQLSYSPTLIRILIYFVTPMCSIAWLIRCKVLSAPSSSSVISIDGDIDCPVTASLRGRGNLAQF